MCKSSVFSMVTGLITEAVLLLFFVVALYIAESEV